MLSLTNNSNEHTKHKLKKTNNMARIVGVFMLLFIGQLSLSKPSYAQPTVAIREKVNISELILGTSPTNDTELINNAISQAQIRNVDILFEARDYEVQGTIYLPGSTGFYGSKNESSSGDIYTRLITPPNDPATKIYIFGKVDSKIIDGLIFDNVMIDIISSSADNITISNNLFVNTNNLNHLRIKSAHNSRVENNVMLRTEYRDGTRRLGNGEAINTYKTSGTLIANNIIGGVTDQIVKLSLFDYDKAEKIASYMNLSGGGYDVWNSDYYSAALLLSDDINMIIRENIIHGDNTLAVKRNHLIYGKTTPGIKIYSNYFSGWYNDDSGGVKLRDSNGPTLIAHNYFDQISILTYGFEKSSIDSSVERPLIFSETLIYANYFKIEQDTFIRKGVISHWDKELENATEDQNDLYTKNYVIFRNSFDSTHGDDLKISPRSNTEGKQYYFIRNKKIGESRKWRFNISTTDREDHFSKVFKELPDSQRKIIRTYRRSKVGSLPTFGTPKLDSYGNILR